MALVACPDCGTEISDQAPACVKCGRPANPPLSRRLRRRLVMLFGIVTSSGVAAFWIWKLSFSNGGTGRMDPDVQAFLLWVFGWIAAWHR